MPTYTSPEVVVQRQLDAYNAKNLDGWLATDTSTAQILGNWMPRWQRTLEPIE